MGGEGGGGKTKLKLSWGGYENNFSKTFGVTH